MTARQEGSKLQLMRLRFRRQFPLIRRAYEAGVSSHSIARAFKFTPQMICARLKKAGVVMRPANGSCLRVDVCACGKPALRVGSLCLKHKRLRDAELERIRNRVKRNIPAERWKYQF